MLQAEIMEKSKAGQLKVTNNAAPPTKRRRWDQPSTDTNDDGKMEMSATTPAATTPSKRWGDDSVTPSRPGATPGGAVTPGSRSQWDETPGRPKDMAATPGQSVRQWAETPGHLSGAVTPGRDLSGSALIDVSVRVNSAVLQSSLYLFVSQSHCFLLCKLITE